MEFLGTEKSSNLLKGNTLPLALFLCKGRVIVNVTLTASKNHLGDKALSQPVRDYLVGQLMWKETP